MDQINSELEYQVALRRLEEIFAAKKGTEEGEELVVLAALIEGYEDRHFPIMALTPEEEVFVKDF